MADVYVGLKLLNEDAKIPKYEFSDDAGMDLRSIEDVIIKPGEKAKIRTGIAVELPPGYEFKIIPRSGITCRTNLRVNLGTIDSGYRGEIAILVDNISQDSLCNKNDLPMNVNDSTSDYHGSFIIRKGDRICQMTLKEVPHCIWIVKDELSPSTRSTGGFGHTGVN